MAKMWKPETLTKLIETFKKLPGIGERSAERIAFAILKDRGLLTELREVLDDAEGNLKFCSVCHVITDVDPCPICTDETRDDSIICVVERPQDVFIFESLGVFNGKYHVLGGVISPMDGVMPEDLHIEDLKGRVEKHGVKEVILALSPTVEGDATSNYIAEMLRPLGIKITRLARGIPTGADLSFADEITLKEALNKRTKV